MQKKGPIYGRKADLEYLLTRIKVPGLTVVSGLPKQGKTRLLEELRDRLAESMTGDADIDGNFLVGYDEALRDSTSILKRALKDLYTRWLDNSNYFEQAKKVWQSEKKNNIIERFGELASEVSDIFSKINPPVKAGSLFFNWLVTSNRELRGESIIIEPPLSYELACDILGCLHDISGKTSVIILDAFERSGKIDVDSDNMDRYLSHRAEWPPCHFILAVRQPPAEDEEGELKGYKAGQKLEEAHPGVEMYPLEPMDLSDPDESNAVYQDIAASVDNQDGWFDELGQDKVLELLNGYPGTLVYWQFLKPSSVEQLHRLEMEARKHQYTQLKSALVILSKENRPLFFIALRLALLPELRPDSWEQLQKVVFDGDSPPDALADLEARKILQEQNPPSFGHTTRYDSARHFLVYEDPLKAYCRAEFERLILECAANITDVSREYFPYCDAMVSNDLLCWDFNLDVGIGGLINAARSLMRVRLNESELVRLLESVSMAKNRPRLAPIISMSLFNAFNDAEGDEAVNLLGELRKLYKAHTDDPAVRKYFATGLFNAFNNAEGDLAAELLGELRKLYQTHSDDPAVRERLAKGLVNAIYEAEGEDIAAELLGELRKLYQARSVDPNVREKFASGLVNAMRGVQVDLAAELLGELRDLYQANSDDPAVREKFAMGLFNVFNSAEGDIAAALLSELRKLYQAHGDDPAVRERLAKGLVNAYIDAEGDIAAELLKELRGLYHAHTDDPAVRELLAKGLASNTLLMFASGQQALARSSLDELNLLQREHPDVQPISDIIKFVSEQLSKIEDSV